MRFLIVFLSMLFCVELWAYQSRVESIIVNMREDVTGHLKMHHQWAPQNAPPCDMNNLHICRVFSRVPKYFFF